MRKESKIKGRTVSIGFDEKELTGEISKGNFNVSVVFEYITVASEEGQVVVNVVNVIAWSRASSCGTSSLYQ